MRGLLTKDIRLILGQRQFLAVMLLMSIFFVMQGTNAAFGVGYLTMLVGMLTVTTVAYDEYNNGAAFLFTMPFSRRSYVAEKYVLGIGLGGLSCLVITVLAIALEQMRQSGMDVAEFVSSSVTVYLALELMLALMLPIQFKFGSERGRLAFALVGVAAVTCILGIGKIADRITVPVEKLEWLADIGPIELIAALALVVIVCMCVSIFISVRIMEKKQF